VRRTYRIKLKRAAKYITGFIRIEANTARTYTIIFLVNSQNILKPPQTNVRAQQIVVRNKKVKLSLCLIN
jgi:hypothetical protein